MSDHIQLMLESLGKEGYTFQWVSISVDNKFGVWSITSPDGWVRESKPCFLSDTDEREYVVSFAYRYMLERKDESNAALKSKIERLETDRALYKYRMDELRLIREHQDAKYKKLHDAAKWVLYTTIHGVSLDGGKASMQEREDAIESLQAVIATDKIKEADTTELMVDELEIQLLNAIGDAHSLSIQYYCNFCDVFTNEPEAHTYCEDSDE